MLLNTHSSYAKSMGTICNFLFAIFLVTLKAAAVIDSIRKWSQLLHGHKFTLLTDQEAVFFMLDPKRLGETKNKKIQLWQTKLETFEYDTIYYSSTL